MWPRVARVDLPTLPASALRVLARSALTRAHGARCLSRVAADGPFRGPLQGCSCDKAAALEAYLASMTHLPVAQQVRARRLETSRSGQSAASSTAAAEGVLRCCCC